MRVVVTGGAGFIGSHIVDRFVAAGHSVMVLDNLSTGTDRNVHVEARLVEADIRSEKAAAALVGFAPEALFHCAAQIDVRESVRDMKNDADVNIIGLINVLDAARMGDSLRHVVFSSTGGALYGRATSFPTSEDEPPFAESGYAMSKWVGEQYLSLFQRLHDVNYTALRYANVYGPRQPPHGEAGVIAIFCTRILAGQDITIFGDGNQTRDFVNVADIVEANVLALEHRLLGAYNVGSGVETNINTLAQTIANKAGLRLSISFAPARRGELLRSCLSAHKLRAETGFMPKLDLSTGVEQTLRWLVADSSRTSAF